MKIEFTYQTAEGLFEVNKATFYKVLQKVKLASYSQAQ